MNFSVCCILLFESLYGKHGFHLIYMRAASGNREHWLIGALSDLVGTTQFHLV
ncbi:hypothetical protein [Enterobacter hormaechei]|uniref:hypothetical protein n=1 Tax=Enterobacter hormaechei TaxID=158836 RepID=UPI0016527D03|nr:hypothetical protein [Enterobacter hormaechei]